MFRRLIACSYIALWLLLVGIDFAGDAGLIQNYRGSETDRAVDSALNGYGQATNISNNTPALISPILSACVFGFSASLDIWARTGCSDSEKLLFKKDIPIYKRNLTFLI